MDMDWISFVFKRLNFSAAIVYYLYWFILSGCTHQKKVNVPFISDNQNNESSIEKSVLTDEDERFWKDLTKDQQDINLGPQWNESKAFIDKTAELGLLGHTFTSVAAVDLNLDHLPDLMLMPSFLGQPKFFLYQSELKKFVPTFNRFEESESFSFAIFADFDRDGVVDAFTATLNQKNELRPKPLRYWQGHYRDGQLVFKRSKHFPDRAPSPIASLHPVDVNLDGRLDLFIGHWFGQKKQQMVPHADELWLNLPEGWKESSQLLKGEHSSDPKADLYPAQAKPTWATNSCDMDNDGWPDLLTASSAGHDNKLWMNRPARSKYEPRYFEDRGRSSQYAADTQGFLTTTGGGRTFCSVCADYNQDGIMDIFLCELTHGWDPLGVDRSSVLTGSNPLYPPQFLRTEYMSDTQEENWNQGDKRANWADLNLDGRLDIVVDNSGFPPHSRLVTFLQDETQAFTNEATALGVDFVNPQGTIVVDFNVDGKPDILSAQFNVRQSESQNRLYFFENLQTVKSPLLTLFLEGDKANKWGWGSLVSLFLENPKDKTKKVLRYYYHAIQGGIPSQSPEGLRVALPENFELRGVKVRWPYLKNPLSPQSGPIEHRYRLPVSRNSGHSLFTLCESGAWRPGKLSCR